MALLQEAEGDTRAVAFGSVADGNEGLSCHAVTAGFEVLTVACAPAQLGLSG